MNTNVPAHLNDDPMGTSAPVAAAPRTAAADAEMQRAITEVQASIVLAKKFPRDYDQSVAEVKRECARIQLAEVATYEYAKGGNKIEGPSIRLAEAIALCWGNIHSGWRELSRTVINGIAYAEIEAWAWDMEKNKRENVNFKVKLMRDTKKGSYPLKDEREIYEHCANNAKRRERAVILAVIPGWVQDIAVDLCKETLAKTVNSETTAKMIAAFKDRFDVSKAQIEEFIQCDITAITPGQVVRLRQIFNSLKDGMSNKSDWFEEAAKPETATDAKGNDALKAKLAGKGAAPAPAGDTATQAALSAEAGTTAPAATASPSAETQSNPAPAGTAAPSSSTEPAQAAAPATSLTDGNGNPADEAPPAFLQRNPSSSLIRLMDDLEASDFSERQALWDGHKGQELFDATGKSPKTAELLKALGIDVVGGGNV